MVAPESVQTVLGPGIPSKRGRSLRLESPTTRVVVRGSSPKNLQEALPRFTWNLY
jgi:hypothetical protein